MVWKRIKPIDLQQIFNHAFRIFGTDHYLRNSVKNSPRAMIVAIPSMVLSAFASELFLKCLLIIETGEPPPE